LLLIVFCSKFQHKIYFDTGHSNKRRVSNIQILCYEIISGVLEIILAYHAFPEIILAYHAFTGCEFIIVGLGIKITVQNRKKA